MPLLMEEQERAARNLRKSALRAAVDDILKDARDTIYTLSSYIADTMQDALEICRKKISGSVLNT